jgi:SAM-dependent methyltransferase
MQKIGKWFQKILKPDEFYFGSSNLHGKVMNFGCGARKNASHIGVDVHPNSSADIILQQDEPLPFQDDQFDYIISRFVFEHIDELGPVFSEISRVLKPEGIFYFSVPHVWSVDAFDDPTHKSFFTRRTMSYYCDEVNVVYGEKYFHSYNCYLRVTLHWPRFSIIRLPCSTLLAFVSYLAPKFSEHLLKLPFLCGTLYFEVKPK